jgi:hypothetical protein
MDLPPGVDIAEEYQLPTAAPGVETLVTPSEDFMLWIGHLPVTTSDEVVTLVVNALGPCSWWKRWVNPITGTPMTFAFASFADASTAGKLLRVLQGFPLESAHLEAKADQEVANVIEQSVADTFTADDAAVEIAELKMRIEKQRQGSMLERLRTVEGEGIVVAGVSVSAEEVSTLTDEIRAFRERTHQLEEAKNRQVREDILWKEKREALREQEEKEKEKEKEQRERESSEKDETERQPTVSAVLGAIAKEKQVERQKKWQGYEEVAREWYRIEQRRLTHRRQEQEDKIRRKQRHKRLWDHVDDDDDGWWEERMLHERGLRKRKLFAEKELARDLQLLAAAANEQQQQPAPMKTIFTRLDVDQSEKPSNMVPITFSLPAESAEVHALYQKAAKRSLIRIDYTAEEEKVAEDLRHLQHSQYGIQRQEPTAAHQAQGKAQIDIIPNELQDLTSISMQWDLVESAKIIEDRIQPWLQQKSQELLGEESDTFVQFICSLLKRQCRIEELVEVLRKFVDRDAEKFTVLLWQKLLYHIAAVRN